jgi:Zn-dependent oligopeptidase
LLLLQMATYKQANDLMAELTTVARPVSRTEDTALQAFARNATGDRDLQLKWWDNAYWAERQKEAVYRVKQEELRQYLPLPSVKEGMFKVRAWQHLGRSTQHAPLGRRKGAAK